MGCDIHAAAQLKNPDTESWFTLGNVELCRDYALFAILAGVRNGKGVKPIDEPRGLPEGFGSEYDDEHTDLGDHSRSYVDLQEINERMDRDWRTRDIASYETLRPINLILTGYALSWGAKPNEIRLVFGFDN